MTDIIVKENMKANEYYMAAVLYLLSGKTANIKVAEKNQKATYENPENREKIKSAVPGYNSRLMNLAISATVEEALLDDPSKEVNEKIHLLSSRIEEFVII